jgi:carbamoyltransferase
MIGGLKLTHDGALAVLDGNDLVLSYEVEKVDNNPRYSALGELALVSRLLDQGGLALSDIDLFAVDGWGNAPGALPVVGAGGEAEALWIAGYSDDPASAGDPLRGVAGRLRLAGAEVPYRSHPHTLTHVFGGYCTSPFAPDGSTALVVVWDGGIGARLYSYDPATRRLANHGLVLETRGNIYPIFASFLQPYREVIDWTTTLTRQAQPDLDGDGPDWLGLLTIPGKAMAYAGLGQVSEEGVALLRVLSERGIGEPSVMQWTSSARRRLRSLDLTDASLMATFQEFLYQELEAGLEKAVRDLPEPLPLCFVGGCALNIKFNSRLRSSGLFDGVWVPPFPNDAGSAIGAACVELVRSGAPPALNWSVFAGPGLAQVAAPAGWTARSCTIGDVAAMLARDGDPIVVLSGRAELGPRALGHRSIIAPATDAAMKDRLNAMKGRESYRPVAPICLEGHAPAVFDPGTPDPFMLFDHLVRPAWTSRIPAVMHADGTARLQTVGPDNAVAHDLLTAYHQLTGVPVLCNTSANLSGRGFFPDAASAMRWGRTPHVWADGVLYSSSAVPA